MTTRKPCYRKDDRAMHPIYGCPEVSQTPPFDTKNVHTKFEVRSFIRSWNRGYSKNLGSPCIRPRSSFSQIFNRLLFVLTLWIYLPNLKFVALPIP